MATYYVDTASSGGDGTTTATSGAQAAFATVAAAQAALTGDQSDNSLLFKCGCTWREQFTVGCYGTSGHVFTIGKYSTGADPIILGSVAKNDTGNWTDEGSNVWYASGITVDANVVWRDGTRMTKAATKVAMDADGEWWMDGPNDRAYVYHVGNPATGHTYEIPQRDYCISATDKSYVTMSGFTLKYVNQCLLRSLASAANATNWTVSSITGSGAWRGGLFFLGDATHFCDYVTANSNTLSDIGGQSTYYFDGSLIQVYYGKGYKIYSNDITLVGFTGIHDYTAGIICQFSPDENVGAEIYRNYIHGSNTVSAYAAGIGIGRAYYLDLYENYIIGNYYFGIWVDETAHDANDGSFYSKYHHNFVNMTGANVVYAFNLEVSSNDAVYCNVVDARGGNDAWAFWMGVGASTGVANTVVYNNTLLTDGGGITAQFGSTVYDRYLKNVTAKNNIFYYEGSGGAMLKVDKEDTADNGHLFNYNCYYDAGSAAYHIRWMGTSRASLAAFKTAEPAQEVNGIEDNPDFTDVANDNFTLSSTSPCIDIGVDLGATYQSGLGPSSTWPGGAVLVDQETHAAV